MSKAVNTDGIDDNIARRNKESSEELRGSHSGACGETMREPVPAFNETPSENVWSGKHNAWIVLGRDRPGSKASGYSGKAHTQCGAIDIVVGRMGRKPLERDNMGDTVHADNNMTSDSARIYISQKTDIDKNFGLAAGAVGAHRGRSGIGIKADHVRIIGREGIKLVTKTDVENSQGGKVLSTHGIDLIAGNNGEALQPMVLGNSLVNAFWELAALTEEIADIVHQTIVAQAQFNLQLQEHVHVVPVAGPTIGVGNIPLRFSNGQTSLSFLSTDVAIAANLYNFQVFKGNYLIESGEGWFLSRANNVN